MHTAISCIHLQVLDSRLTGWRCDGSYIDVTCHSAVALFGDIEDVRIGAVH